MDFSNRAYDRHLRDLQPSLSRIIIVNSDHIEPGCSQSTDDHLGMPAGANNGHAGYAVHGCVPSSVLGHLVSVFRPPSSVLSHTSLKYRQIGMAFRTNAFALEDLEDGQRQNLQIEPETDRKSTRLNSS